MLVLKSSFIAVVDVKITSISFRHILYMDAIFSTIPKDGKIIYGDMYMRSTHTALIKIIKKS